MSARVDRVDDHLRIQYNTGTIQSGVTKTLTTRSTAKGGSVYSMAPGVGIAPHVNVFCSGGRVPGFHKTKWWPGQATYFWCGAVARLHVGQFLKRTACCVAPLSIHISKRTNIYTSIQSPLPNR